MFHQGANLRALIGRSRQTSETTIPHCLSDTHGYGDESTSTTTGSPERWGSKESLIYGAPLSSNCNKKNNP